MALAVARAMLMALVMTWAAGLPAAYAAAPDDDDRQRARDDDKLHLSVDLGLWATSTSGTVGALGFEADADADFTELVENLAFGAMGGVSLEKENWLVMFNGYYVRLEEDVSITGPLGGAFGGDIDATLGIADFALGYTVLRHTFDDGRRLALTPGVGVRYTSVSLDLNPDQASSFGNEKDWWDPYVGAQLVVGLNRQLDLRATGTIGGFGISGCSDLTWSAAAFLDWHFADSFTLNVGYRALSWDYEDGGFEWDLALHGPWLGLTWSAF
jgi:hypothetical protein